MDKRMLRQIIRLEIKALREGRGGRMKSVTEFETPIGSETSPAADIKALSKIGVQVKSKKDISGQPNWLNGKHGSHLIQIKRYNGPSQFGINKSRITILYVKDTSTGKVLADYDRGWNIKPSADIKQLVDQIVKALK